MRFIHKLRANAITTERPNVKSKKFALLTGLLILSISLITFNLTGTTNKNNKISTFPESYVNSFSVTSENVLTIKPAEDAETFPPTEYTWGKEPIDKSNWNLYEYSIKSYYEGGPTLQISFNGPIGMNTKENYFQSIKSIGSNLAIEISYPNETSVGSYKRTRTYEVIGNIGTFTNVTRFEMRGSPSDREFKELNEFRYVSNVKFNESCPIHDISYAPPCGSIPMAVYSPYIVFSCKASNPSICDEILKTSKIDKVYPNSYSNSYPVSY